MTRYVPAGSPVNSNWPSLSVVARRGITGWPERPIGGAPRIPGGTSGDSPRIAGGGVTVIKLTLARLIGDPALRRALGDAGFARTTTDFSLQAGADRLAERFAATLAAR